VRDLIGDIVRRDSFDTYGDVGAIVEILAVNFEFLDAAKRIIPGLEDVAVTLSDTFDTRVRLELGRTKGRIVVEFATQEDLKRIMTIMAPQAFGANVLGSENDARETDLDDRSPQVELSR
jgi:carbon monoxide dehydrogenase subunit G